MATKLVFEDENYEMDVFINQFNKVTFQSESKTDETDYHVIQLEDEDVSALIDVLRRLLKINKDGEKHTK